MRRYLDEGLKGTTAFVLESSVISLGVGKALLDHAEFLGRQQGIRAIRLDTYEKNLPAAAYMKSAVSNI